MLMTCQECGAKFSTEARACPQCGWRRSRGIGKWVAIAAFLPGVMLVFGFISSRSPEGIERSNSRAAIELCWKDQARRSLDPAAARFAAGACEMMEERFRQKWGFAP